MPGCVGIDKDYSSDATKKKVLKGCVPGEDHAAPFPSHAIEGIAVQGANPGKIGRVEEKREKIIGSLSMYDRARRNGQPSEVRARCRQQVEA
jgi:hypothetical protein